MESIQDFTGISMETLEWIRFGVFALVIKAAIITFFWSAFKSNLKGFKKSASVQPAAPLPDGMPHNPTSTIGLISEIIAQTPVVDKCECCNGELMGKTTISHSAVKSQTSTIEFLATKHCEDCTEHCTRCVKPAGYAVGLTESMLAATSWRLGYSNGCIVSESIALLVKTDGSVYVWREGVSLSKLPQVEFLTDVDKKFIASKYEQARKNIFASKFPSPVVDFGTRRQAPPSSEERATEYAKHVHLVANDMQACTDRETKAGVMHGSILFGKYEQKHTGCTESLRDALILSCIGCGLKNTVEPTVRQRFGDKVYCKDCIDRVIGRHPEQTAKADALGYWTGMDINELKKRFGNITDPIPLRIHPHSDSIAVNIYKLEGIGDGVEEKKEVLVLRTSKINRPIFIFYKHPGLADVEFICGLYKAFGHWPKPEPLQANTIGHKEDCRCATCR